MTYTYEETIELLQRAVAEKGDAHTAFCMYRQIRMDGSRTDEPVCIVGHVLSYVGLLSEARETDGVMIQPAILREFSSAAIRALDIAQRKQDGRETWGEALIAAKGIEL